MRLLSAALFAATVMGARAAANAVPNAPAPWQHPPSTSVCATCHGDIATEHAGSAHAHAVDDPIYRAQLALDPSPFCKNCHQATATGCTTCHSASITAKPDVCKSCHQFAFPDVKGHVSADAWMQSTWTEAKGASCTTCHNPHDLHADGKPVGVEVTARREEQQVVLLFTLRARTAHAFPTGDVFRQLEVVCESGNILARSTPLQRVYRLLPTGARRVAADMRLLANGAPFHLEIRIDAKPGASIAYRVDHLRTPDALAHELHITNHRTTFATGSVLAP